MKTFIAMLIMSVGFMLFAQTGSIMEDYTTQRVKLREAYILSIKKLNENTIGKLNKLTDEQAKAEIKNLTNWDSMDEISTKPENVNLGIPGVKAGDQPKIAKDKDVYPDGTILFSGHHYLLVKESMNYNDTLAECKKLGGHLITINNKEIKEFFIKTAKSLSNNPGIWIKGINADTDKEIVSLLGIKGKYFYPALNPIVYKKAFSYDVLESTNYFVCEWDK